MTSTTRTLQAVAALTLLGSLSAVAQTTRTQLTPKPGYLTDSQNSHVMAGNGVECWRTGEWTPAMALEPCDAIGKKVQVTQAAPEPAAAPVAPLAVAPVPAPAPVARPVPLRMRFSADALFEFDKSVIGPEGRKMLDDLSAQLKTANVDVIHITGHTDRLGSNSYNQKLSERRAQVVREYIVAGGFADSKIDAKGMGETQPVTATAECKGMQSAKVIACLQPDRRVDVELQGTQTAQP